MESDLKYIVYITVNLCNGKLYIGVHKTNPKVFDGYIGCGTYNNNPSNDTAFCRAVRKYGYKNFKRTTIKEFPNTEKGKEMAYKLEAILVNDTFIKSKSVYNECRGGLFNINPNKEKPVYMFNLYGKFIDSFKNAEAAVKYLKLTNIYSGIKAIHNCCLGTSKEAFGYFWSYKKEFKFKPTYPIAQYTFSGKYLRYFNSIAEAELELHTNCISQAIQKGCAAAGYQWKKFTGDTSDIPRLITTRNRNKVIPIIMYDKNMNKIAEYSSINECVNKNPDKKFINSQIQRVCKHIIKTHRGYIFKYKDEDIVLSNQK